MFRWLTEKWRKRDLPQALEFCQFCDRATTVVMTLSGCGWSVCSHHIDHALDAHLAAKEARK